MGKILYAISLACLAIIVPSPALAGITIGVSLPLTGPASGLGIATKNGIDLWPSTIAGEKLKLIVLDDAGDPVQASKNAHRFVTEKVDLILGSTSTPAAIAIAAIATDGQTVQLCTSPMLLPPGKDKWTFRLPQSSAVMASGIVRHMKDIEVRSVAFLGYSDAYGEDFLRAFTDASKGFGVKLLANERFARGDNNVNAQVNKLVAVKPDAVLIVASGAGAAMPHKALISAGYKGKIYQAHSAATRELIREGGKDVEGAFVIAGLAVYPEALPDFHPSKTLAVDFVQRYEKRFGPGTRNQFAANAYDAQLVLAQIVPIALKTGKPGTPEFRIALKNALETKGHIVITQGVVRYTKTDHFGLSALSRMMLTIQDGSWKAVPQ